jgi:insulysin
VSKKFESTADQTEKWYGTKYKMEEISQELMKKWQDAVPSNELQLPGRNEFIPSNLDLFPKDDNVKDTFIMLDVINNRFFKASSQPLVVHESALARAWFKQDDEFLLPKANLFFEITT